MFYRQIMTAPEPSQQPRSSVPWMVPGAAVAITAILAFVVATLTHQWLWYMAVPIVAILGGSLWAYRSRTGAAAVTDRSEYRRLRAQRRSHRDDL